MYEKDVSNKIKRLSLQDAFTTLAITCFTEQLPAGEEALYKSIHSIHSNDYQIIAIKHDKSSANLHYHILIRIPVSSKRKKVSAMLKELNVKFRSGIDDQLVQHRAIESCGEFPAYATYLLHQTPAAKRANKVEYKTEDFITNLTKDEIATILDGYNISKRLLKKNELASILDQCREAGYNLQSFDDLINSFAIFGLTPAQENSFKKAFMSGVEARMNENKRIPRLSLFIIYPENVTYAIKYAIDNAILTALSNERVSTATGSEYIHFDQSTEALVFFNKNWFHIDYHATFTDKITTIQKPISDKKSIWAGSKIISTLTAQIYKERYLCPYGIHDSCVCCTVENNKLNCISVPTSPVADKDKEFILEQYKDFRIKFENALQNSTNAIRLSIDDFNI